MKRKAFEVKVIVRVEVNVAYCFAAIAWLIAKLHY